MGEKYQVDGVQVPVQYHHGKDIKKSIVVQFYFIYMYILDFRFYYLLSITRYLNNKNL